MPISDLHAQKRKATTPLEIFSASKDQVILSEGPSILKGIFILPTPCYGLNVPRERGISYPSSFGISTLINQEYGCNVT